MSKPIVSVIMPSFNSARFIGEAIDSLKRQTLSDWELLVIDDCSMDNTVEIINEHASADRRIHLISNSTNQGPGYSRNRAIQEAKGMWIAFLDSDDVWVPHKLKTQLAFADTNDAVFVHSSYGYLDKNGNQTNRIFKVSTSPVSYGDLLKRTEISCLTAMYNQDKIGKFYMSSHRHKQDYALWLSILKAGYISYPQSDVLAFYRQTPNSNTRNKWQLISKHYNFLRQTQNLNHFDSAYYTCHWAINGFSRYYL